MGRTIHYEIFGDLEEGPVPEETRKRIIDVQRAMNRSFTWTAEQLALELDEHCALTYSQEVPRPWAPRIGWGFTKVGDDEWNAALVVRFLNWVATQVPSKAFVRLYDEGDYVIPGRILFRHGQIALDETEISRHREYLSKHAREWLPEFERNVAEGRVERWLRPVSALDYLDRPEIAKVRAGMKAEAFHELILEDVADRIAFPWKRTNTEAA